MKTTITECELCHKKMRVIDDDRLVAHVCRKCRKKHHKTKR